MFWIPMDILQAQGITIFSQGHDIRTVVRDLHQTNIYNLCVDYLIMWQDVAWIFASSVSANNERIPPHLQHQRMQ